MTRYIVPRGFESTAHKIFFEFVKPPSELNVSHTKELEYEICDAQSVPDTSPCNQCPICLSDYTIPVTIVTCTHSYCMECLLLWYAKKIQCPLCKTSGRLFVRNDDLSVDRGVKVFSVDTIDADISTKDIKRAIQIHRQRFLGSSCPSVPSSSGHVADSTYPLLQANPNRKPTIQDTHDSNMSRKARRRRSDRGDVHATTCDAHALLDEASISRELRRVRKGLARAASCIDDIDDRIKNFHS
jgi:hypothetical protein